MGFIEGVNLIEMFESPLDICMYFLLVHWETKLSHSFDFLSSF